MEQLSAPAIFPPYIPLGKPLPEGFPFSRRKLKDLIRERRLNGFDRCLLQPKGTRLWVLDAEAFVRWMSEQRGGQVRRRKPRKTAA